MEEGNGIVSAEGGQNGIVSVEGGGNGIVSVEGGNEIVHVEEENGIVSV